MQRTMIRSMELGLKGLDKLDGKMVEGFINSLNLFEKIVLRLTGVLFIASFKLEGWESKLPFYLFRCSKHGYQIGYPNGHGARLICFECIHDGIKNLGK